MSECKKVMVTGGFGYVGSHCVVALVRAGYDVIVVDNLQNSSPVVYNRLIEILDLTHPTDRIVVCEANLLDTQALDIVFAEWCPIHAVMHLAGSKSVQESVMKPLMYYQNNLVSTINLLNCMIKWKVPMLVFSSSATVYGLPEYLPINEEHPTGHNLTNSYGQTKFMIEQMLFDLVKSQRLTAEAAPEFVDDGLGAMSVTVLRYFNPVGADSSGRLGECPLGTPANLMPFLSQVAAGLRPSLNVFGDDYDTPDGTGIRDYLHVSDLAEAHVQAIRWMNDREPCVATYNLGTGRGTSVLELIKAMEEVCNRKIHFEIRPRREGDVASVYCDASKANRELGWRANRTIRDMCQDQWRWQTMNPNGYRNK